MKPIDSQAWAVAYKSEYIGFKERGLFKVVRPKLELKFWIRSLGLNTRRIILNLSNVTVRHVYAQEGTSKSME